MNRLYNSNHCVPALVLSSTPLIVKETCDLLLSTEYDKSDKMSLPWLSHAIQDLILPPAAFLTDFEGSSLYELYGHKEMNSASNLSDLGSSSFPIDPPNENPVLADILIAALQRTQLSCAQILHPENLWDNKCILF